MKKKADFSHWSSSRALEVGLSGFVAPAITARENSDVQILYPMHLNPNVREPVNRILGLIILS